MTGRVTVFQKRLLTWYAHFQRELPWRVRSSGCPDPYHVLVSETMLQQTQVSTVVPYFLRFIDRLPNLAALASADEQEILRLWQGLGYYSRARNLHATAKMVMQDFSGQIPRSFDQLLSLPGVGRYTAGAIASIAFNTVAPILDGNVARVLCRLDAIEDNPRRADVRSELWQRAEQILPRRCVGDFNSALMELGATLCTPKNPKCLLCPVRMHCQAHAAGIQDRIPVSTPRKARPLERRWTFCIQAGDRWLIERRPPSGRWAGLWQFVTTPAGQRPSVTIVRKLAGVPVKRLTTLGQIDHDLTHRRYHFHIFRCESSAAATTERDNRAWATLPGLSDYPMSRPHQRIAALLGSDQ
jgi:A/G-specific adenine glycosylase